jgi:hypothetical protein
LSLIIGHWSFANAQSSISEFLESTKKIITKARKTENTRLREGLPAYGGAKGDQGFGEAGEK